MGGAISNENTVRNSVIAKRLNMNIEEKRQIAKYALKHLIKPNMIITLDSGTTNIILAEEIVNSRIPCTIITNSFQAAQVITKSNVIQLCLAGGTYDRDHGSPDGVDEDGLVTNAGVSENFIKIQLIKHAKKTYILADHTKLGNTGLKIICTAQDVEGVITDDRADVEQIRLLKQAGFHIFQ